MLRLSDLTTFEQFREVERLEGEIWGPIDLLPVSILAVTVRRGAVLLGAHDGGRLAGFVYSFPILRQLAKQPPWVSHWSHMLAVHPDYRGAGAGRDLKVAQRDRVLALGLDLIEWTYDPLQAANAHLNFVKLGVVVEDYEENVYGESESPLHGGLPTDRFICQWWIRRPHVERRVHPVGFPLVAREVTDAPVVNATSTAGEWLECTGYDAARREPRLAVDIPHDYTAMLAGTPDLARRWRFQTREIFTTYFAAGYRVVDFVLDRAHGRGRYLLTNIPPPE